MHEPRPRLVERVVTVLCSLTVLLSHIHLAQAAEPLRPAVLQVPSMDTGTTFLLLYGKRWDLFKQEGLDLRIVVAKPNLATATLVSGDAQFSAQFQSCYFAGIRGLPVKSFMVINSRVPFHLVVRPEIKSADDLRGKSIGVASLGTATHYAAKKAIAHFGLNPDRDVTYLGLGALKTRLNALETNVIQASILSAPWHLLAKQFGGLRPDIYCRHPGNAERRIMFHRKTLERRARAR